MENQEQNTNSKGLYPYSDIAIGALIGGPLIAGLLVAENYNELGEHKKALLSRILGVVLLVTILGLPFIFNAQGTSVGILSFSVGLIFALIQQKRAKEYFAAGGKQRMKWPKSCVAIGLVVLLLTILSVVDVFKNDLTDGEHGVKNSEEYDTYIAEGQKGASLYEEGKYLESIAVFQGLADKDENDAEAYLHIAIAKYRLNDLDGAKIAYTHALEHKYNDSNDRAAYGGRAAVLSDQKEYALAEQDLRSALAAPDMEEMKSGAEAGLRYYLGTMMLLQDKDGCPEISKALSSGFSRSNVDPNISQYCHL